jgi:two-component system C4-dicarboxylate transport sensor histidine kinase DctB
MNIHRACERVQELLRDLLNVSRGQGRDLDFYCLGELVEAATESVDSEGAQVRLAVEIDDTLEVFGERARIERVFTNLLSNAVEAMPGGGVISVQSSYTDSGVSVFVEDTGSGIPPEMHMDVFRPFVSGKRSGLGLGLALSRQTMLDIGGNLSAMAPRKGSGACFCVYFAKVRKMQPLSV